MLKVFFFCFYLLISLNSNASNATIELLRDEFKNAHKPGESFIGSYRCHFTHVDGRKVQKLEASLSSHGGRFIFTVLDNREVPHTEIVIDNGNDYVSSFEVWGVVNRSFRRTSKGNLIIEIASHKTKGILLRPVTHYPEDIFVQYYGLCTVVSL